MLIESPYSGGGVEAIRYLACCLFDSILLGEAPIASHALYPLALPERATGDGSDWPRTEHGHRKQGRAIGKECHGALLVLHEIVASGEAQPIQQVAYVDMGKSSKMKWNDGDPPEERRLTGTARDVWLSGEWPTSARWSATNESANEGGAQ